MCPPCQGWAGAASGGPRASAHALFFAQTPLLLPPLPPSSSPARILLPNCRPPGTSPSRVVASAHLSPPRRWLLPVCPFRIYRRPQDSSASKIRGGPKVCNRLGRHHLSQATSATPPWTSLSASSAPSPGSSQAFRKPLSHSSPPQQPRSLTTRLSARLQEPPSLPCNLLLDPSLGPTAPPEPARWWGPDHQPPPTRRPALFLLPSCLCTTPADLPETHIWLPPLQSAQGPPTTFGVQSTSAEGGPLGSASCTRLRAAGQGRHLTGTRLCAPSLPDLL